jgi:hypothetical protein
MSRSDRAVVWVGSVLSVFVGAWVAALFGLAFGVLALFAHAWGRWRKIAVAGIGISTLALVVAAAVGVYIVLSE